MEAGFKMQLSKLEKAWFDYPDDPARFEIKHLLSGDLAEIEDQAEKEMVEFTANGITAKVDIKKKVRNELTVCAAVTDWSCVDDADKNLMECNPANKLRLCRELPQAEYIKFLKFIADSRDKLAKQILDQQEQAEGN
jgi:hypothetical protein